MTSETKNVDLLFIYDGTHCTAKPDIKTMHYIHTKKTGEWWTYGDSQIRVVNN